MHNLPHTDAAHHQHGFPTKNQAPGVPGKSLRNRGGLPVTLTAAETSRKMDEDGRKMDGTACMTQGAPVLCLLEAPQMGRTRATETEEIFIEMDHYQ